MTAIYASPLRWIKLAEYCRLSGDTSDAVHARRRKLQLHLSCLLDEQASIAERRAA